MRKKFMIKMASIGAVVLLAAGMAACGKKTEAVITTDGEEFSEPEKEYPTVAQSRAKKFSYNDLTVGKLEYLMTEDEVIKILGEPVTSYNANEKSTAAQTEVVKEKIYSYNELTLIFSEIIPTILTIRLRLWARCFMAALLWMHWKMSRQKTR